MEIWMVGGSFCQGRPRAGEKQKGFTLNAVKHSRKQRGARLMMP